MGGGKMWVIVVLFLVPDAYRVASDQVIYKDERACEAGRIGLVERLNATAPPNGKTFVRCVNMLGGLRA